MTRRGKNVSPGHSISGAQAGLCPPQSLHTEARRHQDLNSAGAGCRHGAASRRPASRAAALRQFSQPHLSSRFLTTSDRERGHCVPGPEAGEHPALGTQASPGEAAA